MSYQAVTAAFNSPITDKRKLLALVALANHHIAKTGLCNPSQKQLASEARCDETTLRRYLRWFEQEGYITRKRCFNGKGHRTKDSYTLHFLEASETLPGNTQPETLPGTRMPGRPKAKTLPGKSPSLWGDMADEASLDAPLCAKSLPGNSTSLPGNMVPGIITKLVDQNYCLPGKVSIDDDSLVSQGTIDHHPGPPDDAAALDGGDDEFSDAAALGPDPPPWCSSMTA
jgi:hypothetical protein